MAPYMRQMTLLWEKASFHRNFGADDEARTRYLHLGKVALYQMSYIRKWRRGWECSHPVVTGLFLDDVLNYTMHVVKVNTFLKIS